MVCCDSRDVTSHITCRFSGATPVAGTSAVADATSIDTDASGNPAVAPALTGALDGEITQLLRSLSKRDATTKSKALQARRAAKGTHALQAEAFVPCSICLTPLISYNTLMQKLKAVIASKDAPTVAACLPAWAYVFNKLVMDNNRFTPAQICHLLSCTTSFVATSATAYGLGCCPIKVTMLSLCEGGPSCHSIHVRHVIGLTTFCFHTEPAV